jgi:hypothetical protein
LVDLADFFLEVAASYERRDGLATSAQTMLKEADRLLAEHAPGGILIQGSGGKGMATYTPWVGFFNPDETDTPQRGIYVVYLLSEDMEVLALSLNQGIEYLRRDVGDRAARIQLANDAEAIRARLATEVLRSWNDPIDLRSKGARQRAYEAGSIACRTYKVGSLPSEDSLEADLATVLRLYEDALAARHRLLVESPGLITSSGEIVDDHVTDPLLHFRPKDASDYRAVLSGRELIKSRRHERLVADFARACAARGFSASNEHPQDLVLRKGGVTYLVEAKMVYRGNATEAVRAAIGQLLSYSYFLYDHDNPPVKVALFSEPVGDGYVAFLEANRIAAVWWERGSWKGSLSASRHGLV